MQPAPFVKWAGGKSRLLSQYEPYFPADFGRYIEPFVGAGAVFFHLQNHGQMENKEVVLIDHQEELINCYRVIQTQTEDLIKALQEHAAHGNDKDYFYNVRAWDRAPDYGERSDVQRAARFIFLNHTCYNGLFRVNRKGYFNVPFGRYHKPRICNAENLRAVGRALQDVKLVAGDFELCKEWARSGDFIYLDPPYHPPSDTANFTSYTSDGFDIEDQRRLAMLVRELDRRGCRVMLSNSYTDLVRDLYDGYEQVQVQAIRAINSKGADRGAIPELLVMNY